jgi:hypothetical protein
MSRNQVIDSTRRARFWGQEDAAEITRLRFMHAADLRGVVLAGQGHLSHSMDLLFAKHEKRRRAMVFFTAPQGVWQTRS